MKFLDVPQSGSIADRTHSHNRAGQYTRNRRAPVQPIGTGRRSTVRAAFAAASSYWSTMSDVQRAAWDSFAPDHPVTDSLGQSIILTGHQMFVRVQSTRQNVAQAISPSIPEVMDLPNLAELTVAVSAGAGITIDCPTELTNAVLAVAVSRPVSAGRSFMKTFWQPHGSLGYTTIGNLPMVISTATYAAEFGAIPLGGKIFVRVTPSSEYGWPGTARIISRIATV